MSIPISGTNYSDVDGNYQRNIQIDGKQIIYQEDNTPPIPNDSGSITWNDFFKLVTNLDAVGNTPNATTLKVENTLLLDNGVNTRTITATSNPATTITVAVTNENQTFYPVFADGDGTSKTLLVDDATTTLSYNPSTSQLACSQVNADIQSVASTQNATHYIGMYDSSSTGYGRPQKSSGLTFNPSTRVLTVTDGTNSTVIFSTHIVDDVKELCNDMAILNGGRILKHIKPQDSTKEIKNKIWTKSVSRENLEDAEKEFNILSSNYNIDNSLTIRVFSEKNPGKEFKKADPQLDDVYFIALKEDQNNNS